LKEVQNPPSFKFGKQIPGRNRNREKIKKGEDKERKRKKEEG